jgi:hypothetical protein
MQLLWLNVWSSILFSHNRSGAQPTTVGIYILQINTGSIQGALKTQKAPDMFEAASYIMDMGDPDHGTPVHLIVCMIVHCS